MTDMTQAITLRVQEGRDDLEPGVGIVRTRGWSHRAHDATLIVIPLLHAGFTTWLSPERPVNRARAGCPARPEKEEEVRRFMSGVLAVVLIVAFLPGLVVYRLVRPWIDTELLLETLRSIAGEGRDGQ